MALAVQILQTLDTLWSSLSYTGFTPPPTAIKRTEWAHNAHLVLTGLQNEDLIVQLDTSGGKTVIALLVILALRCRTLFLVPTRLLASQHHELANNMGIGLTTQIIIGSTTAKKRAWNDTATQVIFATPQTFQADYRKGLIDLRQWTLLVIDEAHRTTGRYDFVPIVTLFTGAKIRLLGLSASPAETPQKLDALRERFGGARILPLTTRKAFTPEDHIVIPLTPALASAEEQAWKPLLRQALRALEHPPTDTLVLSRSTLDTLARSIHALPQTPQKFRLLTAWALYTKLLYAYRVFMVEGFSTFLVSARKLAEQDTTQAARKLLGHPHFCALIRFAQQHLNDHPKTQRCLRVIRQRIRTGKTSVVFFGEKSTALAFQDMLQQAGIVAETLFGGKGKSLKQQRSVIAKLRAKEILVALATSVVEEGVAIPQVDGVINYSLPQMAIAHKQRSGRTGRLHSGYVLSLVMDHVFDRASYWRIRKREKVMRSYTASLPYEPLRPRPVKSPQASRSKRNQDAWSGELFPETLQAF